MAKLFRTSGTGSQQQTLDTTDEKIKIYADDTALDTDLTNIPDGEIVATKESTSGGDSGYVGEIPLGTWASFESDTAPNSEWLQAGTTFDANVYPALAMMLGGNTVPERFDHSRPSEYTQFISNSGTVTPFTAQYDAFIQIRLESSIQRHIIINGVTTDIYSSGTATNNIALEVKKGDVVSCDGSTSITVWGVAGVYYKHPLFIKATPTSSDSDYEGTLNSIREFYVRNNTYSTEERLTGGVWIDGKPIYRKMFADMTGTTWTSPRNLVGTIANLDKMVKVEASAVVGSTTNFVTNVQASSTAITGLVDMTNGNVYVDIDNISTSYPKTVIVEYTKG